MTSNDTSSDPHPPQPPVLSDTSVALIVYALYFAAYFTGITWIIGVIIAHVRVGSAEPLLQSHYRFQIRTFWIGVLYVAVGCLLIVILIGFAVLLWCFIWSLVRNIKGVLALNEGRPIADPASWMFG
jgi:uncharacterized membrane protein